jgi:hypothetical protein
MPNGKPITIGQLASILCTRYAMFEDVRDPPFILLLC